jgi:hypothetical protein
MMFAQWILLKVATLLISKEKASITNENPIVIEDREELIYMLFSRRFI